MIIGCHYLNYQGDKMKKRFTGIETLGNSEEVKEWVEVVKERCKRQILEKWPCIEETEEYKKGYERDGMVNNEFVGPQEIDAKEIPDQDCIYYLTSEQTGRNTHFAVPRPIFFQMSEIIQDKFRDTHPDKLYDDEVELWGRLESIFDDM